jgi:adenylate kinase family enzyme
MTYELNSAVDLKSSTFFGGFHTMKIVLSGPPYAGKSTICRTLVKRYGFGIIDFGTFLKRLAAKALTDAAGDPITVEDIVENKARYRTFLQEFATHIGFNDNTRFIQQAIANCSSYSARKVFDCVRTVEQAEFVRGLGYKLVAVSISPQLQARRSALSLEKIEEIMASPLERGVGHIAPHLVDMVVDGQLPPETNAELMYTHFLEEVDCEGCGEEGDMFYAPLDGKA